MRRRLPLATPVRRFELAAHDPPNGVVLAGVDDVGAYSRQAQEEGNELHDQQERHRE